MYVLHETYFLSLSVLGWVRQGNISRSRELVPGRLWHQGNGEMLATSGHRVTEAWGPRTPRWSSGGGLTPSTDSQNEPKSKKAILNRVGLIPSLPSARWCFNSLHPMGSGLDPIQLDVSKDSTFLPTQITELNAEEARYVTSHLHIKYNLIGEAIAALYKYFIFFFFTAMQTSKVQSQALTFLYIPRQRGRHYSLTL